MYINETVLAAYIERVTKHVDQVLERYEVEAPAKQREEASRFARPSQVRA